MTPFEKACVLHLVGDWLLQNDWMARSKGSLRHPAAWVHGAIHGVLMATAFGWVGGVVLGAIHMLIDTRVPQRSWSRLFGQTDTGDEAAHVLIWGDQVMHLCTIALWVLVSPHLPL